MFKYEEIIEINENYSPYYDLLNEGEDTWKRFIITQQFYQLLNATLDCLEKENISLWLQGAYGTGKSHATGFLKHLLWLPWTEVEPWAEKFHDSQVKHRFVEFRKKSRVFPVIMYGADKITNQIDFALQIEIGVRKALHKLGKELTIKTDYEVFAETIERDNSNYWDKMIEDEYEISELVTDKKQMIARLRAYDQDLFTVIRDVSNKRLRPIAVPDIVSWLTDVCKTLKEENFASSIVIYWDEFTTILDKHNSEIQEYIQRIAEASQSSGVFLYLISHRTIAQGSGQDDRKKLLGRFNDVSYEMSNITTYLLMSNSIRKKDYDAWKEIQEKFDDVLKPVIEEIADSDESTDAENLRDLFPIHPYTANIATYIARVMGSSERSIFNFLYDDKTGFKYFISKYPGKENCNLLTVDYVFDFFEKEFDNLDESFMQSIMQKLRYNESVLKKESTHYLPLFKTLLIMNVAHRRINLNTDNNLIVIPDEYNLDLAMEGSHLKSHIPDFLDFIDQKKIIIRDHKDRFIIEASSYDASEVNDWMNKNRGRYRDISEIISSGYHDSLFNPLRFNHKRYDAVTCVLEDAQSHEHIIKQRIGKRLNQNFNLNFMVFVAHDSTQLGEIKSKVALLALETDPGICFIVMDTLFTDDHIDKFLTFKAQNELAHGKHEEEAASAAQKNLEGHLKQWIKEAVHLGFATWYVVDKDKHLHTEKCSYKGMPQIIDTKIAPIVFYKSFDIMGDKVSVMTAWKMIMAKKAAEYFLSSANLGELNDKTNTGPYRSAAEILLDKDGAYLVNSKLELVSQPQEHPLIILMKRVSKLLSTDDEINLGDAFAPLFKPPFGYYKNHVFLAAIGFALRKYTGKLYSPSTGEALNEIAMLELIEKLFKYHVDGQNLVKPDLTIRIGSAKESELVKLIEDIFELEPCSSIVDTRHKLADWLKLNVQVPLWLLRFRDDIDEDVEICIQIIADKIIPISSGLNSLSPKEFEAITNELIPYRHVLRQTFKSIDENERNKLFIAFSKQNTDHDIESLLEDKLGDLIEHLKQNLQGDPIYWDEEKMKFSFMGWLLTQMSPPKPPEEPVEPDDTHKPHDPPPDPTPGSSKVWEMVMEHKDETWRVLKLLIQDDLTIRSLIYERLKEILE